MILINLMPHREAKRKARLAAFQAGMVLAAIAGAVAVFLWYGLLTKFISDQKDRNEYLRKQIAELEVKIQDVQTLEAEIGALQARQSAVQNLQNDRNVPVNLLNQLVSITPSGIYFTSIQQDGFAVMLTGKTQSNDRVSDLLKTISENPFFEGADLIEIRGSDRGGKAGLKAALSDFNMRVRLRQPASPASAAEAAAEQQSASAASAVSSGASALKGL